jgi:hypothetical protein
MIDRDVCRRLDDDGDSDGDKMWHRWLVMAWRRWRGDGCRQLDDDVTKMSCGRRRLDDRRRRRCSLDTASGGSMTTTEMRSSSTPTS